MQRRTFLLGTAAAVGASRVAVRPMADTPAQEAVAALYIVKPFAGQGMSNLFSTHPPMEERVRRLRAMR